jgi:hypothetical protein
LPRSEFRWEHLPVRLVRAIAEDAGLVASATAADLAELYGTPPSQEFVRENWEMLREGWLPDADETRRSVVAELWGIGVGYADDFPTGRDAEMAFLRTCNNAGRLRVIVLDAFLTAGERHGGQETEELEPGELVEEIRPEPMPPVTTASPGLSLAELVPLQATFALSTMRRSRSS